MIVQSREEALSLEGDRLFNSTSQLQARVERYRMMVILAENDLVALVQRVDNRSLAYEELQMAVEKLRSEELELLRTAMDATMSLNRELFSMVGHYAAKIVYTAICVNPAVVFCLMGLLFLPLLPYFHTKFQGLKLRSDLRVFG